MRSVLTSINPPHTERIFDNKKFIEWRTKPMPTGLHYCYETKNCDGAGMIIGEFRIFQVRRFDSVDRIPRIALLWGRVPKSSLADYSKGKPLYAHFITEPKKYEIPLPLSTFGKCGYDNFVPWKRPPQSWGYCERRST